MIPAVESALWVLLLVIAVAFVAGASRRFGFSAPLVLVVVGVAASFLPFIPTFELDPELVLVGLLPPLLYAAAIRTSLIDFRAAKEAVLLLAVGLVAVTVLAVGFVAWLVVPGVSVAAALALGAVVSPPDAVAATAVGRRVGLPRRMVTVLEGESLVNDATALVALTAATAAITESVTPVEVGLDFLLAAGGGLAIGLAATWLLAQIRRRITDPVLDTTLSFTAPYVAFLPAEAIHSSGVLAVVVTGLLLGHKAPRLQSGASRLSEAVNWRTVQFMLENAVFLLIGLQVQPLVEAVWDTDVTFWRTIAICGAVLGTAVVVRALYTLAAVWVYRHGTARMRANAWTWPTGIVISWAGMRGVVTLAAAFALPSETPQREVLQLAALGVVGGTLLVQGLTLPWLVARLKLPRPSPGEDALQSALLVTRACQAGLERLEEVKSPHDPEVVLEQLRARAELRTNGVWERLGPSQEDLETPAAIYRRLRLQMLDAERNTIVEARDAGAVDDEVLRSAMAAVDLEESLLERVEDASAIDGDLVTPFARAGDCAHLRDAPLAVPAHTPEGCEECLRDGLTWVHLRLCLSCGHVGCCDSSVGRHATRHFQESDHAVMRSIEPGEAWRWCFVDQHLG
jgi:CPA1 family monovalent cation:H+ antiporter